MSISLYYICTHEYSVCNAHGLCAIDPSSGFVRCLCDNGWEGAYCQNKVQQHFIIISLVLCWKKMKPKIRKYHNIKNMQN